MTQSLGERAFVAFWVVTALATIFAAITVSYVGSVNAPFGDEWRFSDPANHLQRLFERYNGHPFVIGRLLVALDYYVFDAQGWALRAGTLIVTGAWVLAGATIASTFPDTSRSTQLAIAAAAAIAVFNPQSAQNFFWGFQIAFVLAFAAGSGAIAALAHYAFKPRAWKLALTIALSVVSSLSVGPGLVTSVALLLMALALGLRRSVTIGLAALMALTWTGFLLAPGPSPADRVALAELPFNTLVALQIIGSAPSMTVEYVLGLPTRGPQADVTRIAFGLVLSLLSAWLAFFALFKSPRTPGRIGALGLIFFALATAGMIGLVRDVLARHYVVMSCTLLLGLVLITASYLASLKRPLRIAVLAVAALAAVLTPLSAVGLTRELIDRQRAKAMAQSALVVGVLNQSPAITTRIPRRIVRESVAAFRAHDKSLFRDPWSHRIGEAIPLEQGSLRTCANSGLQARFSDDRRTMRLIGQVARRDLSAGASLVVLDANRVMVGYGLIAKHPADLIAWVGGNQGAAALAGFARAPANARPAPYTAYLGAPERLICRFAAEVAIPRRAPPPNRPRPAPAP